MNKLGSQKLHICPKVTKIGSIIGHRIDYNGVGALRGACPHVSRNSYPEHCICKEEHLKLKKNGEKGCT